MIFAKPIPANERGLQQQYPRKISEEQITNGSILSEDINVAARQKHREEISVKSLPPIKPLRRPPQRYNSKSFHLSDYNLIIASDRIKRIRRKF